MSYVTIDDMSDYVELGAMGISWKKKRALRRAALAKKQGILGRGIAIGVPLQSGVLATAAIAAGAGKMSRKRKARRRLKAKRRSRSLRYLVRREEVLTKQLEAIQAKIEVAREPEEIMAGYGY